MVCEQRGVRIPGTWFLDLSWVLNTDYSGPATEACPKHMEQEGRNQTRVVSHVYEAHITIEFQENSDFAQPMMCF